MSFRKFTQAEKVTPVTPQQNERANVVRDAGGQPKLASISPTKDCGCSTPCGMPCGNY